MIRRAAASMLILSSLPACTTIEVSSGEEAISIERRFGFAAVEIAPETDLVTARISGLGYVAGPMGYTLGYSSQEVSTSDGACGVIIWTHEGMDLDQLAEKLRAIEGVCVIGM